MQGQYDRFQHPYSRHKDFYTMSRPREASLADTGERMIPPAEGEVSVVFARHQFAYQYAQQFVSGKKVIDVGCGTGYGCKMLAQDAATVYGVDHDQSTIAYCRSNYNASNIQYKQLDAAHLDLHNDFDVAVSFQVIEHMRDAGDFVNRLKRAVKPGGMILITTPNVRTPRQEEETNPFHFSEMNYGQLKKLIEARFDSFEIKGVTYASKSKIRSLLAKLPIYRFVGKLLKRKSVLKKAANKSLGLSNFRIIDAHVARDALDLLAVCQNS